MRIRYGNLIDFEIEKRGFSYIYFKIHDQHPATICESHENYRKSDELRELYYESFQGDKNFEVNSFSYPEVTPTAIYLRGGDGNTGNECEFETQAERDRAYDQAINALAAWSQHSPCKLLWVEPYKQVQLRLI